MAVPRTKYEMFADIRYDGRLVDVLDRIREVIRVYNRDIKRYVISANNSN